MIEINKAANRVQSKQDPQDSGEDLNLAGLTILPRKIGTRVNNPYANRV